MPAFLLPLLNSAWTALKPFWPIIAALVLLPLVFMLGRCDGTRKERNRSVAAQAVATVEVMKTDGSAKEVAATERVNDNAVIAAKREDLIDAVAALPDETPSVRRAALGCARLRANGIDVSSLPACK